MKKFRLFLTLMLAVCLLSGCRAGSTIQAAKLTENEASFAKLLAAQTAVFDVDMAAGTRSLHVNLYRLHDGKWEFVSGGGVPVADRRERIVLAIDPDDGVLKLATGGQTVSFQQDALDFEVRSVTASKLDKPIKLEWDQEVPAYLYIETGSSFVSGSLNDFDRPESLAQYERVYALTVMVSQRDAQ